MRSAIGKARGLALRVSYNLEHLYWCVEDGYAAPPGIITEDALLAAAKFVSEYAMPLAERTYGDAACTLKDRNTATLARWTAKERPDEVHVRNMQHTVRLPGLTTAETIHVACKGLIEAGWLILAEGRGGQQRGREAYPVSPRLKDGLRGGAAVSDDWAALYALLTADNGDNGDNGNVENTELPRAAAIVTNVTVVSCQRGMEVSPLGTAALTALECRRPDHIDAADWQHAVERSRLTASEAPAGPSPTTNGAEQNDTDWEEHSIVPALPSLPVETWRASVARLRPERIHPRCPTAQCWTFFLNDCHSFLRPRIRRVSGPAASNLRKVRARTLAHERMGPDRPSPRDQYRHTPPSGLRSAPDDCLFLCARHRGTEPRRSTSSSMLAFGCYLFSSAPTLFRPDLFYICLRPPNLIAHMLSALFHFFTNHQLLIGPHCFLDYGFLMTLVDFVISFFQRATSWGSRRTLLDQHLLVLQTYILLDGLFHHVSFDVSYRLGDFLSYFQFFSRKRNHLLTLRRLGMLTLRRLGSCGSRHSFRLEVVDIHRLLLPR